MEHGRAALRRELGADAQVVDELSEDEATQLAELIDAQRRRQDKALSEAIDTSLRHLPRLVRGPARKILFG